MIGEEYNSHSPQSAHERHEAALRSPQEVVRVAESAADVAIANLAAIRIEIHEKAVRMLRTTAP